MIVQLAHTATQWELLSLRHAHQILHLFFKATTKQIAHAIQGFMALLVVHAYNVHPIASALEVCQSTNPAMHTLHPLLGRTTARIANVSPDTIPQFLEAIV